MKNLKYTLIFLIFFSFTIQTFAQKGFDVINKAALKYENGQNKRALKLLSKAENMNFGFCGNAWMEADRAINLLRSKIYINEKEYQLARNSLDSIGWEHYEDNFDSIRIRTYQMEYGKDSLSSMIDTSLVNIKVECGEYDCIAIIPLTNGKSVKLKGYQIKFDVIFLDDEKKQTETWVNRFKESENYKLIKEKSGE